MPPVTLISPEGDSYTVEDTDAQNYIDSGFKVASSAEETGLALESAMEREYGDQPLVAGAQGFARGLTFGGSDVLFRAAGVSAESLRETAKRSSTASTIGEIGGVILPTVLTGGTNLAARGVAGTASRALRYTPAGAAAKVERAITGLGAGKGAAGKIGAAVAGGAAEGALQGVGSAITDVAMENKPLTAEAFVASAGKGALFGGAAGGVTAGAAEGLQRVRKLFPAAETTDDALRASQQEFKSARQVAGQRDDAMRRAARAELDRLRVVKAAEDLKVRQQLDEAKIRTAEAKARQVEEIGKVKVSEAEEIAKARIERAKVGRSRKPRTKVADEPALELPRGFDTGALPESAPLKRGFPESAEALDEDAVYVLDAADLVARNPERLSAGIQPARRDSIRKAWEDGKTVQPVRVTLNNQGKVTMIDGYHTMTAAAEDGRQIAVRVVKGVDEEVEAAEIIARADPRAREIVQAQKELDRAAAAADDWTIKNDPEGMALAKQADELDLSKFDWDPDVGARVNRETGEILDEGLADAKRRLDRIRTERGGDLPSWVAAGVARSKAGDVRKRIVGRKSTAPAGKSRSTDWDVTYAPGKELAEDVGPPISLGDVRRMTAIERASLAETAEQSRKLDPVLWAAQRSGAVKTFRPGIPVDEGARAGYQRLLDETADAMGTPAAGRVDAITAQAAEGMAVLGRYERAQARMADALGDAAPLQAAEHAQKIAAKVDEQGAKMADKMAKQVDDAAGQAAEQALETISPGAPRAQPASVAGRAVEAAQNVGTALELMQMAGLNVPSAERLPVVGPLVSAYLKGRAFLRFAGGLGGRIPLTADTAVAGRAAQMRDRAAKAVDRLLAGAETGLAKARPALVAGGTAATLNSSLFDGAPKPDRKEPASRDEATALFRKRANEVAYAATNPEAVRQKVRASVPVSSPDLQTAIEDAAIRKLQFLHDKAPKDTSPPSLFAKKTTWQPSPMALAIWARYVRAAEDPVSVIDDLRAGTVTPEAAETLQKVYPEIYTEVQRQLIDKAPTMQREMPYAQRVQLGLLFEAALDDSMRPESQAFLQSAHKPQPPEQPTDQPPQPPTPAIAADVSISNTYQTGADRRAQRY